MAFEEEEAVHLPVLVREKVLVWLTVRNIVSELEVKRREVKLLPIYITAKREITEAIDMVVRRLRVVEGRLSEEIDRELDELGIPELPMEEFWMFIKPPKPPSAEIPPVRRYMPYRIEWFVFNLRGIVRRIRRILDRLDRLDIPEETAEEIGADLEGVAEVLETIMLDLAELARIRRERRLRERGTSLETEDIFRELGL